MSISVRLCTGMSIFAEKVTGVMAEGFIWEVDTDSQTLTITGEGALPNFNQDYHNSKLWKNYGSHLHHLILEGVTDTEWMKQKAVESVGRYLLFLLWV